jgi:hypothetical protein
MESGPRDGMDYMDRQAATTKRQIDIFYIEIEIEI